MSEGLVVVNFAHPLTDRQRAQVEALAGRSVARVVEVETHVDLGREIGPQVAALVDGVDLGGAEWQTAQLVINPPALSILTAVVLAELHGRTGYFPTLLLVRPEAGSVPPRYEVAELVGLQAVRDGARTRRWGG